MRPSSKASDGWKNDAKEEKKYPNRNGRKRAWEQNNASKLKWYQNYKKENDKEKFEEQTSKNP